MIINRIYENQKLLSLVSFLVGLRTYQHLVLLFNEHNGDVSPENYCTARRVTDDWCMSFPCCITKSIHTHSKYVILTAFHRNNTYTNSPQCYVIPTASLLPNVTASDAVTSVTDTVN